MGKLYEQKLVESAQMFHMILKTFGPTHIASMVSGGKDSATSHAVLREIYGEPDLIIHGRTGCGIPQTTDFVKDYYGSLGADLAVADAGDAYEEYVMRKGFFGKGISAHGFAYRILKATPFRKVVSKHIRQRRRNIRVLLVNGARMDESLNRQKNLKVFRSDPAQKGNIWYNIIHNWTQDDCNQFLEDRNIPINPVAKQLCRSGECMCGTMQSDGERAEAKIIFPEWGKWMDDLEARARAKHGFGWGEAFPKKKKAPVCSPNEFQPMCTDCTKGLK